MQLVLDAERSSDLVAQRIRERAAGRAPDDLAEQVAEGQSVVAGRGTRFPPRPLVGEERADAVPITEVDGRDVWPQTGDPRSVDEDVAHRHPVLAMCAELGPDVGHTLLIVQLAVFDQHMRDRGSDAFARRCGEEQGARLHRRPGALIGDSGPRVGDDVPRVQDGDLQPGLRS